MRWQEILPKEEFHQLVAAVQRLLQPPERLVVREFEAARSLSRLAGFMRTVRSEVRGCYQTWSEGVCGGAGNGEQPKLLLLPPGVSSSWHFLSDELICVLVRATSCCSWAQADCWLLLVDKCGER